jgi:hypothetical protein
MTKSGSRVASPAVLALFATLLVLVLVSPSPDAPSPMTSINPLLGDESFVATFGHRPSAADDDELRVRTHLAYVERRLRAVDDTVLPPALRAARRRNLDLLRAYWSAGLFPAGENPAGRQPTFIDDTGRRCAVAALVEASAGTETVTRINTRYRNAYIGQMHDAALAAWIASSGFTAGEVAMIQPTYSGFRILNRWQAAADIDAFYLVRMTGPGNDELRHIPGIKGALRLFDLKYAWLAGARGAVGRSFAGGGTYYDADVHVGYVALSEGDVSLVFKAGGGLDGLHGVVPFGFTVPFGMALALHTGNRTTVEGHPALSTVRPHLQLRGEGKWAVWGAQRAEQLTWTAALDTVWRVRRNYPEKFYGKDIIASVVVTRFAGEIYGGIALGIGFSSYDSTDSWSASEERYRSVLRSPYE